MPFTDCPACGFTTYSAAAYSSTAECPRCGSSLSGPKRKAVPLARMTEQARRLSYEAQARAKAGSSPASRA